MLHKIMNAAPYFHSGRKKLCQKSPRIFHPITNFSKYAMVEKVSFIRLPYLYLSQVEHEVFFHPSSLRIPVHFTRSVKFVNSHPVNDDADIRRSGDIFASRRLSIRRWLLSPCGRQWENPSIALTTTTTITIIYCPGGDRKRVKPRGTIKLMHALKICVLNDGGGRFTAEPHHDQWDDE